MNEQKQKNFFFSSVRLKFDVVYIFAKIVLMAHLLKHVMTYASNCFRCDRGVDFVSVLDVKFFSSYTVSSWRAGLCGSLHSGSLIPMKGGQMMFVIVWLLEEG